jgi:hypothetical protein
MRICWDKLCCEGGTFGIIWPSKVVTLLCTGYTYHLLHVQAHPPFTIANAEAAEFIEDEQDVWEKGMVSWSVSLSLPSPQSSLNASQVG